MKKRTIVASLAIAAIAGFAVAQVVVPKLPTFGPTDLVQIIPGGVPTTSNQYIVAGKIAGAPLYVDLGVATTGNTFTFAQGQTNMIMRPAGTLAAVTLVTELTPSDGQMECFLSTQTTTALTWNAAAGLSISGAPTAGVANVRACMLFNKAALTWYRAG